MVKEQDNGRIRELRKLIAYHRERYHHDDAPEISDEAYDSLMRELAVLEGSTDETVGSEATVVGGSVAEAFSKVKHRVSQWSFSNIFNHDELQEWVTRVQRLRAEADLVDIPLEFVAEHKIDGLKIVLEYQEGRLVRAATRGDGVTGEDVTHTACTIRTLPQQLAQPVSLIVVGEVWLSAKEFERINQVRAAAGEPLFANPRNAAAGTLRQLDPTVAAARALSLFCYDIDWFDEATLTPPRTQLAELQLLQNLGFPVNAHYRLCHTVSEIEKYYQSWIPKRLKQPFGMDGVVLKVNDVRIQRALGYTAKSPRFGVAYKFPSEEATTVIEDIGLQVGRTGVVTPVAHLRPTLIAGSTVSRATLHNEDEIKRLDVRIGDTVIIKKAGDVIPKVLSVVTALRPREAKPYRFPKKVFGCGGDGSIERVPGEAAYRCVTLESDHLHRQRLYHFVSKTALNIDGVGPRIIDLLLDNELIDTYADLFTLEVGDLIDLPGFKEKAAHNVIDAIAAVRTVPLYRLLIALSIDDVGEETARLLAERFPTIATLQVADPEKIAAVYGVGEVVAASVHAWFADQRHQAELNALLPYITIEKTSTHTSNAFMGKTLVFTGTLPTLTRDEAKDMARAAGASISGSVSAKTDFVVLGENAGTKAARAKELGVAVLSEADFLKRLGR